MNLSDDMLRDQMADAGGACAAGNNCYGSGGSIAMAVCRIGSHFWKGLVAGIDRYVWNDAEHGKDAGFETLNGPHYPPGLYKSNLNNSTVPNEHDGSHRG